MPVTFALLCALAAPSSATEPADPESVEPGTVVITGARHIALRPEPPRPAPSMVLSRTVVLRRVTDGIEVRARWRLDSATPRWFATQLLSGTVHGAEVRWNGATVTPWPNADGPLVVAPLDGPTTVELRATVPMDSSDSIALALLGAPRGAVELVGFDEPDDTARPWAVRTTERPVLEVDDMRWSTGDAQLTVERRAPTTPTERGPIVRAQVGVGVTVGDAELRGRGRLAWEIRQGRLRALAFEASGVGSDLQVEGPNVASWRRDGDLIRVELNEPVSGRVQLDVQWSVAAPDGAEASLPMPRLVPHDVFRTEYAVQLARDGELDMRPRLSTWKPIAAVQLPPWASALVEGTPTSAFMRTQATSATDSLDLLRLEPVPGPAAVIEVADLRIATTVDSATIVRARYEVRNERAAHLVVTPPEGLRLVAARVGGESVQVARDPDGTLRIPLKRSLETVAGLMTVPVALGFVGRLADTQPWSRRERRQLAAVPIVSAPIAVQRVSLHLPPGYVSQLEDGDGAVVGVFDRGDSVAYGFADDQRASQADAVFKQAVDAWNDNDFDQAQAQLDRLGSMAASNDNTRGLQANLDLVRPRPEPEPEPEDVSVYDFVEDDISGEMLSPASVSVRSTPSKAKPRESSAVARRIRARARARAGRKRADLDRRKRKAKVLRDEGRYSEAAEEYRAAIEDSRDLDALEDSESVTYEFAADELEGELQQIESRASSGRSRFFGGFDTDGEYDRVSPGLWGAIQEPLVEAEPEPPLPSPTVAGPTVIVPQVGHLVRYQQLLLAEHEHRPLKVDARRRPRLERRDLDELGYDDTAQVPIRHRHR